MTEDEFGAYAQSIHFELRDRAARPLDQQQDKWLVAVSGAAALLFAFTLDLLAHRLDRDGIGHHARLARNVAVMRLEAITLLGDDLEGTLFAEIAWKGEAIWRDYLSGLCDSETSTIARA